MKYGVLALLVVASAILIGCDGEDPFVERNPKPANDEEGQYSMLKGVGRAVHSEEE
ncbi:MAG: hypothetical protein KIT74_00235 [Fimbriimonadales bacterium]|nr:hypothetical protein [Fimbriimonadales bacterium]